MAKYDDLGKYLHHITEHEVHLTFDQIEAIVPGGIPPSAFNHAAWWANEESGSHVHALAWMDSGWRVTRLDLTGQSVTFTRSGPISR
jgi:hypothetical protein